MVSTKFSIVEKSLSYAIQRELTKIKHEKRDGVLPPNSKNQSEICWYV